MDAETLKTVGTLALWGGLFFIMMRYGCGAHMMHGHGGHGHGQPQQGSKDPVCGMDVMPEKAAAATVYQGRTYYFCSKTCRDRFDSEPDKFARGAGGETPRSCHAS